MNDRWSNNRHPASIERHLGVAASIIASLALLALGAFALTSKSYIIATFLILVAAVAVRTGYRAAFGNPELPSKRTLKVVNYLFIIGGVCLVLGSLFAPELSQSMYGVSVGLAGIWAGLHNLRQNHGHVST